MKTHFIKNFSLIVLLFGVSTSLINAQQWGGSSGLTNSIYRNGFVGLNTSSPAGGLHIAVPEFPALVIQRDIPNSVYPDHMAQFGISGSGSSLGLRIRMSSNQGGSWTDALFLRSNGNIGIGTLIPNYRLEVNGTISSTSGGFRLPDGTLLASAADLGSSTSPLWNISAENEISYSGGNVGIGVTDPEAELHIDADEAWSILYTRSNAYPNIKVRCGLSGSGGNYGLRFQTTLADPNWSETLFLGANGRVGIGTVNPGTYKLAVEGIIGAREVIVTLDSWADFVFADDYPLMSLSETESYIQENRHLPDVPSAEEVEEDGISLGEMNAILLQKIEELTLHLIEQEKRIAALEAENAELNSEEQ